MITSHTREEVKQAVAQGELHIKTLTHYDICAEKKKGKHPHDIAVDFNLSNRQVYRIIACKCPD